MKNHSLQKAWKILTPLLVYYVIKNTALFLLVFIIQFLKKYPLPALLATAFAHDNACMAVINGLSSVIGAAFLYRHFLEETSSHGEDDPDATIFVRTKMRLHSSGSYIRRKKLIPELILISIFAAVAAVTMNMVMTLISLSSNTYTEVKNIQYSVPIIIGIILYGIVSPVVEEIVFRGLTYCRTKHFFSKGVSVILVSFMFGAFHGNLVQGIYAFILGILITLAYEWVGSFLGAVVFHAAANITVYILSVSPLGKVNFITPLNCVLFAAISIFLGVLLYKCCKKK